ncbi:MAG: hypothetical protein JW775_06940 [Candidatus Aminicenantes bacterium]|nr:hypothetical protein [Candidatus Aminicenantes bacterium]
MLSGPSWRSGSYRRQPTDRGFKLALPMVVEGPDPGGELFREKTTLAFMSHQGALFPLRNPVALGSRLKLAIALPPKLGEGRNLTLVVKGTIVDIDAGQDGGASSQVAIRLESRYVIQTEASGPAGA